MQQHSIFKGIILFGLIFLATAPANCHISEKMPDPIAEVEYQMMLDFEPTDLLTRYKLAMVYYRLKKDGLARAEFETILAKDSDHFHALEGLGMLLIRQKKYESARANLEKATRSEKRESGTYFYLGKALLGLGRAIEAEVALKQGIDIGQLETEANRAIPLSDFKETLKTLPNTNIQQ